MKAWWWKASSCSCSNPLEFLRQGTNGGGLSFPASELATLDILSGLSSKYEPRLILLSRDGHELGVWEGL